MDGPARDAEDDEVDKAEEEEARAEDEEGELRAEVDVVEAVGDTRADVVGATEGSSGRSEDEDTTGGVADDVAEVGATEAEGSSAVPPVCWATPVPVPVPVAVSVAKGFTVPHTAPPVIFGRSCRLMIPAWALR